MPRPAPAADRRGTPWLSIEPMRPADLPEVARIEALSLPRPSAADVYRRALAEGGGGGGYVVARQRGADPAPGAGGLLGFAGWSLAHDEAHVTIIAVDPAYRRRGVALALLVALVEQAVARGARVLTLEVRVSSLAAYRLYLRFGFREVGRRRAYYADTGEDGLIMTTPPLADAAWWVRFAELARHARRNARLPAAG